MTPLVDLCMNPECDREGTIGLRVFGKHVGFVCEVCHQGLVALDRPKLTFDDAPHLHGPTDG